MTSSGARTGRVMLDTSGYAHLRRGRAEMLDRVAAAEVVLVPTTVLGELEAGFALGRNKAANRRILAGFLAEPFVVVLDVSVDVSRSYGRIFAALRNAGTPIPVNDIWIAAAAITARAHLLTYDSDFRRVRGLSCTVLQASR